MKHILSHPIQSSSCRMAVFTMTPTHFEVSFRRVVFGGQPSLVQISKVFLSIVHGIWYHFSNGRITSLVSLSHLRNLTLISRCVVQWPLKCDALSQRITHAVSGHASRCLPLRKRTLLGPEQFLGDTHLLHNLELFVYCLQFCFVLNLSFHAPCIFRRLSEKIFCVVSMDWILDIYNMYVINFQNW